MVGDGKARKRVEAIPHRALDISARTCQQPLAAGAVCRNDLLAEKPGLFLPPRGSFPVAEVGIDAISLPALNDIACALRFLA